MTITIIAPYAHPTTPEGTLPTTDDTRPTGSIRTPRPSAITCPPWCQMSNLHQPPGGDAEERTTGRRMHWTTIDADYDEDGNTVYQVDVVRSDTIRSGERGRLLICIEAMLLTPDLAADVSHAVTRAIAFVRSVELHDDVHVPAVRP